MNYSLKNNQLFVTSHIVILIAYSFFSLILTGEALLMGWEMWALPLVIGGVILAWILHIRQNLSDEARLWIYSLLMMATYFFYGIHISSTYDLAAVMMAVILLYTMTGDKRLVRLNLLTYYITMGYDILILVLSGEEFDSLLISRTLLHLMLVLMVGWIAQVIIQKWSEVLQKAEEDIGELRESTRRMDDFLGNMSHEIRTPVNAVVGLSAVLQKEELSERAHENVQAISEAGHRVAEQIGNILDFTEIDMDKLTVSEENYMINSLVNDLLAQLGYIDKSGLDMVVDMDAEIPAELKGDESKIRKILWQLIRNGFKFTRDGGIYVRIYARKREYGINLCLEVSDTGQGMSEEEVEHVYEKFYQSDSGHSRTAGGLGIGIPIVNGFVKAMGGMLVIDSTPGYGTTVRVSIPQKVVNDMPCVSVKDSEKRIAAGFLGFMATGSPRVRAYYMEMITHLVAGLGITFSRTQSVAELKKLMAGGKVSHLFVGVGEYRENREYIRELSKSCNVAVVTDPGDKEEYGRNIRVIYKPFYGAQVANFLNHSFLDEESEQRMSCPGVQALVVDDEPMNLMVARGILESYGMEVSVVGSGPEAIRHCLEKDYDIIFMDHMMPEMDGVEAMKRLRVNAAKDKKELCIVALTANAISSAKEMFLAEGFDGFVPKPIELSNLERVLKHVLPRSAIVYEAVSGAKEDAKEAAKDKADGEQESCTPFAELEKNGVDTALGLRYCQQDEEFYRQLLLEYAKDAGEKAEKLEDYVRDGAWKDYCIRVHAVKSTSKMLGAVSLSEQAGSLEEASKKEDKERILQEHPLFLEKYRLLMEKIGELFGEGESPQDEEAEAMEFSASADGEMMEFDPAGDETVMEFGPEETEDAE